jgi:hypothetical protein
MLRRRPADDAHDLLSMRPSYAMKAHKCMGPVTCCTADTLVKPKGATTQSRQPKESSIYMSRQAEQIPVSMPYVAGGKGRENATSRRPANAPGPGLDSELDTAFDFFLPDCRRKMGRLIRRGTDEIIATARTRRWNLDQCNNQEKAYLGVNIENLVRGEYNLGDGKVGMDFSVAGVDVDAKWSRTFGRWQIPQEAVGHICLLIHGDDLSGEMAVGLVRIREDDLVGGNQDKKRTIQSPGGMSKVRWLVPRSTSLPENFLMSLRRQDREAILAPRGGNARARELFKRCEGMTITRQTIEAIGQQADEARRFRGETRATLLEEGFEVLNGTWIADRNRAMELGEVHLRDRSEWVCLRSDGSTPKRLAAKEPARIMEAKSFRMELKKEIKAHAKSRKRSLDAAKAAAVELAEELYESDHDAAFATQAAQRAEAAAESAVEDLQLTTSVCAP